MVWDRFKLEPDHTWNRFLRLVESKDSSEITHARIRYCLNSVSLAEELRLKDHGDPSTRHSRAVTRTVNTILKLAKDLPESERTDACLLQYIRIVVQKVEFAKTAQLTSLADKNKMFEKLNLSILTAAQLEDRFKTKTRRSDVYFSEEESNSDTDSDGKSEDLFDQYFVDRRFGHRNRKRSLKCGNNKKQNGMKNNAVMKCFDCGSVRHLAFHKECPTQVGRMKKKTETLDGVRKQLTKGHNPSEILACLAVASDESMNIEHEESSAGPSEIVEVGFSLDQDNVQESESEDELPLKDLFAIEWKIL